MFSGVAIGLIVALSVSVWVYNKTMERTGNNSKSAMTTAGVAAFISFVVIVTLVAMVDSSLSN